MSVLAKQRATQRALEYWSAKPIFIDTETTGLDESAEIIEISIVNYDGSPLLDTLVKPCQPIPWGAQQVHGISNEMVSHSPTWREIWPFVARHMQGRYVGIYNSDFDLRMIQQSCSFHRMPWSSNNAHYFCIMKLYAQYYGANRWQKLEVAGRQCHINLPNAHRAQADALLARAVLEYMACR